MKTFDTFNTGVLSTPTVTKKFSDIPWSLHKTFTGVSLKHLITSNETNGAYSYHLVKIKPGMAIGNHIHQTQLETHEIIEGNGICINENKSIEYLPGTITIIPANVEHSVTAGDEGLYLFAKFFPALC